jgi:hypothetical protein
MVQRVNRLNIETPASGKFNNKAFWTTKSYPRLRMRDAKDATRWFRSKIDAEMSPNRKIPAGRASKRKVHQNPQIGNMYIYKYEAKWDKQLPTWDRFPLDMVIGKYPDGILSLNFHYLPLPQRYALMASLMKLVKPANQIWEKERLKITYAILQGVAKSKLFEPAIKRKLYGQVRSNFSFVEPDEWRMALAMPIQKFVRGKPY